MRVPDVIRLSASQFARDAREKAAMDAAADDACGREAAMTPEAYWRHRAGAVLDEVARAGAAVHFMSFGPRGRHSVMIAVANGDGTKTRVVGERDEWGFVHCRVSNGHDEEFRGEPEEAGRCLARAVCAAFGVAV